RTAAVLLTGTAAGLGLLIMLRAPLIARSWLINSGVPDSELINSIRLMGLSLACQWPSSLYGAALVGLQRQDLLMIVRIAFASAQSVVAVVLLAKVSASPEVFFDWMAVTSAMLSIALCFVLWRIMPKSDARPKVDIRTMKGTWRFAAGNVAIGLTTALLTQSSSLIIAKYCS